MSNYIYESNDYRKVKYKFEHSSRVGYKHIQYWVISPGFYEAYLQDESRAKIKRINLYSEVNLHSQYSFLGYEVIVSNTFKEIYGVCPVYEDEFCDLIDS